ncbi:MAG: CHAT domain-containing protein [Chloroflexi bacterium]|nr:CHAT domain-containing protein [Chloroflexota bacterium]
MSAFEYETLDLLIEKSGDAYRARIINSPVGQARTDFASPFTQAELDTFFARVGRRTPVMGTALKPQQLIEQMGGRLFDAAFNGEVLTSYRRSRDAVDREEKGLRIRLRLNDVPELADLPWEYMYDASRRAFLALSKETPIVRFLELPERVEPLAAPAPLNLLAVLSSPSDRDPLDVEGEWARLQDALAGLRADGKITLTRLQPPTLDALRAQLRKNAYHIFHFIGHGEYDAANQSGALVFENEQGSARKVNENLIATLLHDARNLRVAVLNACEGAQTSVSNPFAGVAPHLVEQGIPAVLAMQFAISDQAALDFSSELYRTLADGYPIDAAMNEARRAIYLNGNLLEWGTPVLFMRAEDGVIFRQEEAMGDEGGEGARGRERAREGNEATRRGGVNISGNARVSARDIVGGDKIVQGDEYDVDGDMNVVTIGAGAQVGQVAAGRNITQTQQQGASVQDLAALFKTIYQTIERRADDPNVDKDEIKSKVKQIETEAAKGESANVSKVERWLNDLKNIAPDILDVTAAALLNPLAGISTALRKIAEKARAA